jgi:hypothetical protein
MTTFAMSDTTAYGKATIDLQNKLHRLLAKAKPSKRELVQKHFRDLFPSLEAHLLQGKTLKDVVSAFNVLTQSNVCLRTFKEMLAAERARCDENGNPIFCTTCGRTLAPVDADGSPFVNQFPSETPIETTESE